MMENSILKEYHAVAAKRALLIIVFVLLTVTVAILSCAVGTHTSFFDAYQIILDHLLGAEYPLRSPEWWNDFYIFDGILPCVVMSIIAGAGLDLGGNVMQSMMGNPLADPYTTGISSGACLGAVSALIVGFSFSSIAGEYGIISSSFVCALIPAIVVILITKYVNSSPSTMILVGTAISYFFNAVVTLLMISTDSDTLHSAFLWQIGSVSGSTWSDIPVMFLTVLIASILVQLVSNKLNIMALGDNSAKSLGLDVGKFRVICLILLSVLTAAIISYTGIIGFIGLISPHLARFLIGGDNKFVVPLSMAVGAFTLVFADALSRSLLSYTEIPVGVVMSFIGAPVFLYMVMRQKSDKEVF